MGLLASCWLIVESFTIPDGFVKWFYLSFYIHPLLLVFCQIFLWLKELKKWLLLFFFHFTIVFRLSSFIFVFLKRVLISLFSFTKVDQVYYDALETDFPQIPSQDCEIVVSCNRSRVQSGVLEIGNVWKLGSNLDSYEATEEKDRNSCFQDSWLNEYLYSDHYNSSISKYVVDMSDRLLPDQDSNNTSLSFSFMDQSVGFISIEGITQEFIQETEDSEISPSHSSDPQLLEDILLISQDDSVSPVSSFNFNDFLSTTDDSNTLAATDSKQQLDIRGTEDDIDPFHQKYTSRMRFFNVLYHERLHGMKMIMNEHLTVGTESSSPDLPMQFIRWSRMARKRILRSLEYDLEMIYVAQSCLFWEALHHQYQKVEALTFSGNNSGNILFQHSVSGKFQELQILLERFVEDQTCECQRSSNHTHKRLSFQGLLQVPDATGLIFVEEENKMMMVGEGIRATQVLEAINNCIEAFWLYIRTDEKKSAWIYKGIWRTNPPVEDPQDLELLYGLVKTLHKKGIMLKDVQGKNKCWLRKKVKPFQTEDEKRNLLFAMIDMKLVQRLLRMSLVSTSHLRWCQEKLNNLDFKDGKVFRGCVGLLFPSS